MVAVELTGDFGWRDACVIHLLPYCPSFCDGSQVSAVASVEDRGTDLDCGWRDNGNLDVLRVGN